MELTVQRLAHPVPACVVVLLAGALALTGCTGTGGTRAGGEPPAPTLRIGTDDPPGRPASDQMEEFARRVSELSGGELQIEPVFRAAGEGNLAWDQEVARLVVEGELDLAMVPARAWDTEGVETLDALHAPFHVTTEEHLNAVVADDELADDLMVGLRDVGVTGLALLPEGLRHYFSFTTDRPGLQHFDGARIRAPRSRTTWALFEALGATPTDEDADDTMHGAESEFALASTLARPTVAFGNLTFFPKVNSLVVNSDTLTDLQPQQQEILLQAALDTRDWAVRTLPDDATLAAQYCDAGGTVVMASPRELAAIRRATGSVTARLRSDEETARLMDRVAASTPPAARPAVAPCSSAGPDEQVTTDSIVADGGALPDGTYRVEFGDGYLRRAGLSPEMVAINRGVWTIDLRDGQWSIHQVAPDLEDRLAGVYQVAGDELYWRFYEGEALCHLRWTSTAGGDLRFEFLDGPADARFHFGLPWRRVG